MIGALKREASLSSKASTLKSTSILSEVARRIRLFLNVLYTESICTAPGEIPRISATVFLNLSSAERSNESLVYPLSVYEAVKLALAGGGDGGGGGGEGGTEHVAAFRVPAVHELVPETVYPLLHVG